MKLKYEYALVNGSGHAIGFTDTREDARKAKRKYQSKGNNKLTILQSKYVLVETKPVR